MTDEIPAPQTEPEFVFPQVTTLVEEAVEEPVIENEIVEAAPEEDEQGSATKIMKRIVESFKEIVKQISAWAETNWEMIILTVGVITGVALIFILIWFFLLSVRVYAYKESKPALWSRIGKKFKPNKIRKVFLGWERLSANNIYKKNQYYEGDFRCKISRSKAEANENHQLQIVVSRGLRYSEIAYASILFKCHGMYDVRKQLNFCENEGESKIKENIFDVTFIDIKENKDMNENFDEYLEKEGLAYMKDELKPLTAGESEDQINRDRIMRVVLKPITVAFNIMLGFKKSQLSKVEKQEEE